MAGWFGAKEQPRPTGPPLHHSDFWYEGENNWRDCKTRMGGQLGAIQSEFTGEQVDRPYFVQPTSIDKVKDAMFIEAGQPEALKKWQWENPLQSCLVTDYYYDHDFPGDNVSWYRGAGAETIEEFKQPVKWMRLSELGGLGMPYVPPDNELNMSPPPDKIFQGALEDFYFVQACYAMGMKSKLIRDIFVDCEFCDFNKRGMYMLRFYKHSQWTYVSIDDFLPFDKDDMPIGCRTMEFPSFPWASLVEKAYAKLHKSWEAIGGGGSVEEVMTDLTGGCSGRFHTGDCAGDRMWKYFQELQRTTIWACGINERECSKRLIPLGKHYAAAVYCVTQENNVPYIGVFTCAPYAALKHFPMCRVDMPEGYDYTNGFIWLRVDDFIQLFDTIWECRLVNTDLNGFKEPIPRGITPANQAGNGRLPTPGYDQDNPWYELIFAYDGKEKPITAMNCPTFLIDVPEDQTELIMDAGQTCMRFPLTEQHAKLKPEAGRHEQAPLLLRFFECSREMNFVFQDKPKDAEYMATASVAGEIYMVHMSAWSHTRDAMCCVKVLRPGRYVAMVSMPSKYFFDKMTFRVYSSKKVGCRFLEAHRNMIAVNPGMPLGAIPYSLTGIPRIDEYRESLPRMFDEDEGKGKMFGTGGGADGDGDGGDESTRALRGWKNKVRGALSALSGKNGGSGGYGNGNGGNGDEPRGRSVGAFGGAGGGNSTNAVEKNASSPCQMSIM